MDIIELYEKLKGSYKSYLESFVAIKDNRIKEKVSESIRSEKLWPKALIQFNPNFAKGIGVKEMMAQGFPIHPDLEKFFATPFYKHQQEAIALGCQDHEFIVTSGTGSGKSRTFMATIFNYILQNEAICKDKTVAIIVYPMNALINSQAEELARYKAAFEEKAGRACPFTFGKYTGQENDEARTKMQQTPPNIILTNYMMLELLMTRAGSEESLRKCFLENLHFLVFDELHTYRGMQGSDVSFLIRRIKSLAVGNVLCFGTSATMVADDSMTYAQQREKVAEVASCIFGSNYTKEQVIDETLAIGLNEDEPSEGELRKCIQETVPETADIEVARNYPTAIWLEQNVALVYNRKENKYFRGKPISIEDMARKLSMQVGESEERCRNHIIAVLNWCNHINLQGGPSVLPYKIHQFIPQTGNVYATLGEQDARVITVEEKLYCDELSHGETKVMYYPVVFSRLSGHEFYVVKMNGSHIAPRNFDGYATGEDDSNVNDGYIIIPHIGEKAENFMLDLASDDVPADWFTISKKGERKLKKSYAARIPQKIWITQTGSYSPNQPMEGMGYIEAVFVPSPLKYDPTARVVYSGRQSEYSKLARIGGEGRSTATTVLSYEDIILMKQLGVEPHDRKVLTFVDARQDAALQAGHFNDFIRIGKIRSAIWSAIKDADTPIDSSQISHHVLQNLHLDIDSYSKQSGIRSRLAREEVNNVMERYLSTIIFDDLAGNWTVIMPNLEDCALLKIGYKYLHEGIVEERLFDIPQLEGLDDAQKEEFLVQIMDYFRHRLCMACEDRTETKVKEIEKAVRAKLKSPWTLDESDKILAANEMFLVRPQRRRNDNLESAGFRSKLGIFVRDYIARNTGRIIGSDGDYTEFMTEVFAALSDYIQFDRGTYQLRYEYIQWQAGDKHTACRDMVRFRSLNGGEFLERQPNAYFQNFYQSIPLEDVHLEAKDHTGQVAKEEREVREQQFREGEFPILYCSPTMELGIDIKDLSVVGMRNVPPTPANYTQRAGRAGRSGQAALVYTYCRPRNSHENYYLNNPEKMVKGEVKAPRMELINEELFRTHFHSTILSVCPIPQLSEGIAELVDYSDVNRITLRDEVRAFLVLTPERKQEIKQIFTKIVNDSFLKGRLEEERPYWFTDSWMDNVLGNYEYDFNHALDRWRSLYKLAQTQIEEASIVINNRIYGENSQEKKEAHMKQQRGENLRDMLLGKNQGKNREENEFYPYRYMASEGFLPGYNFTKLPQRALLQYKSDKVEYLSRAKRLALTEFGPQNIIYNNGGKFRVSRMQILSDVLPHKFFYNPKTGVVYKDMENTTHHTDIITGESLDGVAKLVKGYCIEAQDMIATETEKITCQEEERSRKYYQTKTFFASDNPAAISECELLSAEGNHLANVRYIPSCRLTYILESKNEENGNGFALDTKTGDWISLERLHNIQQHADENPDEAGRTKLVKLFTETTANAIYIQPLDTLALADSDAVRTFLYAFKQAIEDVFQIEGSEMGAEVMGEGRIPNILVYENAEGSLGVLNRLVSEPDSYRDVVNRAYEICFGSKKEFAPDELAALTPADYTNLLNYYNQPYHQQIDIRKIYGTLKMMQQANIEVHRAGQTLGYDEQYEALEAARDHNSRTEYEFLKYLHDHRLRLPDKAQPMFPGEYYVQPDFLYGDRIVVFCDGTPHDRPEVQADDAKKREVLEDAGYVVLAWHYATPLSEFIARYPDIFTPVN